MMKRVWYTFLIISLVSLTLAGCSNDEGEEQAAGAGEESSMGSTKEVASVNGSVITESELSQKVDDMMQRMGGQVNPEQMASMRPSMRPQALANLINYKLLVEAADAESIAVTEEQLQERTNLIMGGYSGEEEFAEKLKEFGMDRDEFDSRLREQIRIEELLDEKTADVTVPTKEELEKYYEDNITAFKEDEQVRASHILIKVAGSDTEEQKKAKREKLEKILKDVRGGASFSENATLYSDCPSKDKGGDLGFFSRGDMVKPFEEAAFALEEGDISDIVETQFGYHIIKVTGRKDENWIPFEEARGQILQYMENRGKNEAVNEYLNQLREAAEIEYSDSTLIQ